MNKTFIHILCYLILTVNSFGQNYIFNTRELSVEDGMLGRRVDRIVQDQEGFMWIATNEGLNRFDGYRFEHFTKSSHGLSANNITNMGIDDVGDIWITYVADKFIIPETQILRPKTGKILSLKEKLGALYQPKYKYLRVANTVNLGQIYVSLPNHVLMIYQNNQLLPRPASLDYHLIHPPNSNEICFVNKKNTGILRYDMNGKTLDSIKISPDLQLFHLTFTQNGGIIGLNNTNARNTIYYKNKSSATFKPILKSDKKNKFKPLPFGAWADDQIYFEYQNQIIHFDASELITKKPNSITFDKQKNIWVATNNGVIILSIKPQRFRQYLKDEGVNNAIYDGRGIWANDKAMFTFSGSGSYRYNFKDDTKKIILASIQNNSNPHSVVEAKNGSIWVGTKSSLLVNLDVETTEILQIIKGSTNQIWSIFEDKNNRIWVGQGNNGLFYFEKGKMEQSQKYTQLNGFDDIERGKITQIIADKRDNNYLWLSCQSGWYRLHIKDGLLHRYWGRNDNNDFKIPADEVHFTYQDANGDFWLATAYSGLVKVTLNPNQTVANTAQFTIEQGLSSNTIYAIYEDKMGFLWMSTNNGINRFNKETNEIQVFLEEDGLPHYEFNRLSSFQRKDGTLFFGTLNGIVSFHPDDLNKKMQYDVPLSISKCEKYSDDAGKMVNVTAEVLIKNKIIIRPNERLATLYVSLQNYATSLKTKYIYRIKGLQKEFVQANKNEIALSGLPYGKYTLEVKAKAPDGRFSIQTIEISLTVQRPFYLQWWFVLLAIVIISITIWQLFQARTRVLKNRKRELEEIVKDRTAQLQQQANELQNDKNVIEEQAKELRSLDEMKSRFFANISHELRTPLTLILSPIRSVIKRKELSNRDFTSAQIVEHNAEKLLKRINEILDLTKLEAKEMQIKSQPTPFYEFVKRLVATFESLAAQKNQQLTFDYQLNKHLNILLDQNKYEHILNNYLSNAIKFTPKNGQIAVQLTEEQRQNLAGKTVPQIILSVADNGQGIPKEDLPKIFNRFFQSKNNQNKSGSSGIGLALSKEIAQLMEGKVSVKSEVSEGAQFYFAMPFIETMGNMELAQKELTTADEVNLSFENLLGSAPHKNRKTLLLVEDNPQLRNYIQLILQTKYTVVTAENGKEALKSLTENNSPSTVYRQPSAIISDIMMPVMDGFELLEHLKSSDKLRHIPVVMLTARSNIKDKLKALRIGVDDYILKPFEEEELITRIDNLIRNVRERVVNTANVKEKIASTNTDITISSADMMWLKKVERQLQQEISNSKFNIDSLAETMQLSRSHLHRKIKTITGLTPNKYFREIKLQAAREILEKGEVQTVNEVCYAVGFDTPKYFSKVFAERFGRRPISYLKV